MAAAGGSQPANGWGTLRGPREEFTHLTASTHRGYHPGSTPGQVWQDWKQAGMCGAVCSGHFGCHLEQGVGDELAPCQAL